MEILALGYSFYSSQLFQKDIHSPICIGALRLASRVSRASPKIAWSSFTTKQPSIGEQ